MNAIYKDVEQQAVFLYVNVKFEHIETQKQTHMKIKFHLFQRFNFWILVYNIMFTNTLKTNQKEKSIQGHFVSLSWKKKKRRQGSCVSLESN